MARYTKTSLSTEVENQARNFGTPSEMEARFARRPIGGKTPGLSLLTLAPNLRDALEVEMAPSWWSDQPLNRCKTP